MLKYLEVRFWETEAMFDKVFLESSVSLLITWSMRIAKLIEGDIFDPFFETGSEPLIDECGSSLDRI